MSIMKNVLIFSFCLLFLYNIVGANEKPRLAVIEIKDAIVKPTYFRAPEPKFDKVRSKLSNRLEQVILGYKTVRIVERKDLNVLIKEFKLREAWNNPRSIDYAKILSADYILLWKYIEHGIVGKIISVDDASVILSKNIDKTHVYSMDVGRQYYEGQEYNEYFIATDELGYEVAQHFSDKKLDSYKKKRNRAAALSCFEASICWYFIFGSLAEIEKNPAAREEKRNTNKTACGLFSLLGVYCLIMGI